MSLLQVALPQVDAHMIARTGLIAPQLRALEHDGVDRLPVRADQMRTRIGQKEGTVYRLDNASPSRNVARETRMTLGVNVSNNDRIARCETRFAPVLH